MSNKAKMVREPYNGNALKLKEELKASPEDQITYNKIYTHEKGIKWLENSRGYIHIWVKRKARIDGKERGYYTITHYRITKDGKMQEVNYALYSNVESVEQAFEELQ